jgi:hypothetical protein
VFDLPIYGPDGDVVISIFLDKPDKITELRYIRFTGVNINVWFAVNVALAACNCTKPNLAFIRKDEGGNSAAVMAIVASTPAVLDMVHKN